MSAPQAPLAGPDAVDCALRAVAEAGADQADALFVEADSVEVRVRADEVDVVKQSRERVLGIRALVRDGEGFRSAVTSTSDLSAEAVVRMAQETAALARATAADPAAGLPDGGFATDLPDLALGDPADASLSVEARIETARRAEQAARGVDPRITNSEGSEVGSTAGRRVYGNSTGFRAEYAGASHAVSSVPIAADNGSMQMDHWTSVARRWSDLDDAAEVGRIAARRALARLGARRVPTCEVPVVFEPSTARALLSHLAACVSGSSVYRGASFLADKLGEQVASAGVTVVDDGRLPGGLGSKPFDGEGLPTRRTAVIEEGRLASFLLDTYAGRKLGLGSTGNAARGAGSAPGAGPTNLWIEPGSGSLEDIVADTREGLLVTWLFGHGFNPVTGDFSRGAAGLWIENGRATHPVEEITIAGNLLEMLRSVDAVGGDILWQGRVAAPSLRIERMTVAGE
jgi:PmbA protein